ncbi:MAG TPA: TlpA disulfide reductase family protein [Prosthecobacter sp.]|nr:TlpA disulfide reductase family protein [Prosthecobacter sp.]
MKKFLPFVLLAAGLSFPANSQTTATPQQLAQRLFDPKATAEQLTETLKQAGQAGIPRQQLIEAKLIWGLRHQDSAWLIKLLPELEVLAANFDPAQSAGLRSADEIKAFIAYIKALQADEKNDEAAFKQHILEAVWLNPQQAQIFTQVIEQKRRAAHMAAVSVDLTLPVSTSTGEATTLADVMEGKKALLLDFWASWCGPCMQLMPELKKKADQLAAHGVLVAGMNKDDTQPLAAAEKTREEFEVDFPWLIEPADRPFTKLLGIESIPRMILIDPAGKVLYNGHPQDPALWKALQKLDSTIKAPEA